MRTAIVLPKGLKLVASVMLTVSITSAVFAAAPATQPVVATTAAASVAASSRGNVLIPILSAVGSDTSLDWVAKAVQQNLLADLGRAKLRPASGDKTIADITSAQSAARDAGADYVITGSYQIADQQIRLNGQIIETATGKIVGGLSATGSQRDLFALEDKLSAQAIAQLSALPGMIEESPAARGAAAQPNLGAMAGPAVAIIINPPAVGPASSYDGSALQAYVESNRTPSREYNQKVQNASDNITYGNAINNDYSGFYASDWGLGGYYGYGIGGYGIGVPFYGFGYGYGGGYGHGSFGGGYGHGGGFGHGGFHGSGYSAAGGRR